MLKFAVFKIYGPRIMQNRKAFLIEKIQLVYNTLHLMINIYLFKEAAKLTWFAGYSYRCQPADLSNYGTPLRVSELFIDLFPWLKIFFFWLLRLLKSVGGISSASSATSLKPLYLSLENVTIW